MHVYFYVFFVKIERFFKIWSIGILCEVPFQYFHFMDFLNFSWVYMKYCMCEFIVKSKNNFKNSRPQRDQFRVTHWTTLWGLPWDGPDRTDLGLPFNSPFGDHPRISLKGLLWGNPQRVDLPSFLFGDLILFGIRFKNNLLVFVFRFQNYF
jgi:hypothetical protein